MPLSIVELAQVRDTAADLLEELGLDAYLFQVEAQADCWRLKVDCAMNTDDAWESISLSVPKQQLLDSRKDQIARNAILADWGASLLTCKRRAH